MLDCPLPPRPTRRVGQDDSRPAGASTGHRSSLPSNGDAPGARGGPFISIPVRTTRTSGPFRLQALDQRRSTSHYFTSNRSLRDHLLSLPEPKTRLELRLPGLPEAAPSSYLLHCNVRENSAH